MGFTHPTTYFGLVVFMLVMEEVVRTGAGAIGDTEVPA